MDQLVFDIYNILVQIRYPKITTVTVKDVELVLLKGENRISLLSWLLSKKFSSIANELEKLEGQVLEDKLYEYYSGIGVCANKKFLLGNCPWQDQFSILKILLDFIKCLYSESFDVNYGPTKCTNDILNVHINEDSNIKSNIDLNLNYSESVQYFDNLRKYVDEYKGLGFNHESQKEKYVTEDKAQEEEKEINEDSYLLFCMRVKKFIEVFSTIGSESVVNVKETNTSLHSMDDDIKEICLNFSSLMKFLQATKEIVNVALPKGLSKTTTQLNDIVEDIVSYSEEVLNVYKP
ncbi:uncharacterized protein LOC143179055 isoform X1 [Calliopsis andreniformis]|uniref:uncharacterized protein LOC143179055 isoform X1 n=1 Tax=Calliopsis andreniformis TaxID=337506 RepID=UPI003FCD2F1D